MSKSHFIAQSVVASSTPRTLPRVAWLRGVSAVQRAFDAALDHLAADPDATSVTAAFLDALSPSFDALIELRAPGATEEADRWFRRIKQELGLFVPIRLSELLGPENVLTLRDRSTHAAAPRKIPPAFPDLLRVTNYTPHRLSPEGHRRLLAQRSAPPPAPAPLPGLRGRVGFTEAYELINREERNLAAVLFALVQSPENLRRFLELLGYPSPPSELADHAIFFEFAMVRDLWRDRVSGNNELARTVILEALAPTPEHLTTCTVAEFNAFWGAPKPSRTTIQMPATWSLQHMDRTISESDLLRRACLYKWSFNAKPDMVIRLSPTEAVCIEIKLDSGIGSYPSTRPDKAVFNARGLARVAQTSVQRYLMEDLLGFTTRFILLSHTPHSTSDHHPVTWEAVFKALDLSKSPAYVRRTISAVLARARAPRRA